MPLVLKVIDDPKMVTIIGDPKEAFWITREQYGQITKVIDSPFRGKCGGCREPIETDRFVALRYAGGFVCFGHPDCVRKDWPGLEFKNADAVEAIGELEGLEGI
jgi:hypothetical protein